MSSYIQTLLKPTTLKAWVVLALAALAMHSCKGLDELPDNRTDIDTKDKVAQLLTSGYSAAYPGYLCELSSDNLVDNNVVISSGRFSAYALYQGEAYRWESIRSYSTGEADSPYDIWESYYYGIAVCNHAIDAMKRMSTDPAKDTDLAPYWGEAHVLRAYNHFMLANIFAESYQGEEANKTNMCVPYTTTPENTVFVDYSTPEYRHNIADTYALMQQDLEVGLPLIDDAAYTVPAYHFNKRAANAFAARFYLFTRQYGKAKQCADQALSSSTLRNWKSIHTNTIMTMLNSYSDETLSCNYLMQATYSTLLRYIGSLRYAINTGNKEHNVPSAYDIIFGSGPSWSSQLPAFSGKLLVAGSQEYGALLFREYEYFEYKDKIAGIGYVHTIYHPFTAEETLLVRAEANLFLGQPDAAVADLNMWAKSLQAPNELTLSAITSFYDRSRDNIYTAKLHLEEVGCTPLSDSDLAILDCVLHFRRIQTNYEGDRWFDIKRYGIEIEHAYREPSEKVVHTDVLTWNDPRRVLQIPFNVVNAGYPASDRTQTTAQGQDNAAQFVVAPAK